LIVPNTANAGSKMNNMARAMLSKELFGDAIFGEVRLVAAWGDYMCACHTKLVNDMCTEKSISSRNDNCAITPKR
jgi:hypothetical protein